MPIAFACPSCGASFEVDGSLAGKKCKCTRCGSQFIVPAAAPVAKRPVPPPLPEEEDRPRKRSRVAEEEDEGRRRPRRPDDDGEEDDRPPRRRRDEEDDEEVGVSPRRSRARRRGKGKGWVLALVIGGTIGVLCLGLVGGLVWYFWPSGPGADIKYLPDNSQFVAKLQVEDLLDSKAYKQVKDEFPKLTTELADLDKMEGEIGLSYKNVASVLVGGKITGEKSAGVFVVRTIKPVKDRDLLANMKHSKYTETKVGRYTMHEKDSHAFCVPESNLVVYSDPETLKKVLQRDKAPDFSDGLNTAIKETDFSKTLAVAVNVKDLMRKEGAGRGGLGGPLGGMGADEVAKDAESVSLSVGVKSDVSWKVSVLFKDAKSASDAKKLLDAAVVQMKKQAGKELPAPLIDEIEKMEYKVSGNRLETSGSIETAKIIKIIKALEKDKK